MKRLITVLLIGPLIALTIGWPIPSYSDAEILPVPDLGDTTARFQKGLLWKIESVKKTAPPSYLFGTIHSDDQRVTVLPEEVRKIFYASSSFTMEVKIDTAATAAMVDAMFYKNENTLLKTIGPDLYKETRETVIARGLSAKELNKTKPWVIFTMLSVPRPKSGVFLDLKLHLEAANLKKEIYGLESMQEQIAVFNNLAVTDQISLLRETLATSKKIENEIEKMIQAYIARDLDKLVTISDAMAPKNKVLADRLMYRLLTQRNERMVQRMQPRLKKGNAFIAVGALHLPGEEGLLKKLANRGYTVTAIY